MIPSLQLIAAPFAQAEGNASTLSFLLPILIMGGLFYVLLILPQRRRRKQMEEMRSRIGVGADVRTIGGIVGTVVGEDEETFTLDVGGSTLKIIKRAIAERTDTDDA